jgi:hypothetical protein
MQLFDQLNLRADFFRASLALKQIEPPLLAFCLSDRRVFGRLGRF